jgi:P4 family phage/plasmid primase-like protien
MIEYYLSHHCRLTPLSKQQGLPVTKKWTQNALTTQEQADRYPGYTFGWVLDADHLVVDVDPRNGGLEGLKKLSKKYTRETGRRLRDDYPVVRTPRGGLHFYMTKSPGKKIHKQIDDVYKGVDFLSVGSFVRTVGASHPSGGKYEILDGSSWTGGPQLAPGWLLDDIEKTSTPNKTRVSAKLSASQITGLLEQLNPEDFRDHETWLQLMQSVHDASGGAALEEFVEWSTNDPEYASAGENILDRWNSLDPGKEGNVTAGTLLSFVTSRGGTIPAPTNQEEAETLPDLPIALPDTVGKIIHDGRDFQQCPTSFIFEKLSALDRNATLTDLQPVFKMVANVSKPDRNRFISLIAKRTGFRTTDIKDQLIVHKKNSHSSNDPAYEITDLVLKRYFHSDDRITHAADQRFWVYNRTHWRTLATNMIQHHLLMSSQEWLASHPESKSTNSSLIAQAEKLLKARLASEIEFYGYSGHSSHTIINCRNGELHIDSKSGNFELKPHDPASLLNSCLPVTWDPRAVCPKFDKFLSEIFAPSPESGETVRHLWELIGYTIQPRKDIATWVLLTGDGANGKTTLLNIMAALLGDHVLCAAVPDIVDDKHGMACLPGKLMMIDEDLNTKYRLPDGFLKKTSENKTLTANPKFEKTFRFENTVIVWMASNELPSTSDASHGMTRRAQVIHFGRTFTPVEQDKGLSRRIIRNEMSGILRKALQGLQRLRARGYWSPPAAVNVEKSRWSSQGSPISMWMHTMLIRTESDTDRVLLRDAYSHFRLWCQDQGMDRPMTKHSFRKTIESTGVKIKNGSGNKLTMYAAELRGIDIDGE